MTETKHGGVSLRPEDAGEGGLFDDVTVKVVKSRFEMFNYGGKATLAPGIMFGLEDVDDSTAYEQFYSMGSAKDWTPSKDGTELLYVGSSEEPKVRKSTNGMHLITSVLDAGFPEEKFHFDVSVFENMICHMQRIPAPKRAGLEKKERADGKKFEDTILVVDNVITVPWENKGAPKKGAKGAPKTGGKNTTPKSKAPKTETDTEALVVKATNFLVEQLADNADGLTKKDLPVLFVSEFKKDADRNDLVALVYTDEFLVDGPWTYENGVISL